MTLPMHQDAAAAAVFKRTMVLLLLLLMFSLSSFPSVTAECPDKCWCQEVRVYCSYQGLDRIPNSISSAAKLLDLDYNEIRDIESLAHLTELETLYFSNNNISEVKNGAFSNLSQLQALYLHRNKIENIETGVFNNLTSLKVLHLDYNNIHKLDLEMFKGLTKLNRLYLSNNNISEVKNGAFSNLLQLQALFLHRNKIENIETGAFNNLVSLKVLQLDYNNIHKLDLEMFKGLTKLNRLFLDHNMIRNIPPGTLDSLTSLRFLQLDHNPLTCDCNILLFVKVLKKNYPQRDVLGNYDPSCHFPVEMSEKSLKEITENDFNCTSPDIIVVPENKTVSVGEQLQLSCKAVGDPEPFITWAKDDIDLEHGQRVQVFQNNTLIISKVERTDGGQYKCVASNYLGRKSFEAMVNVYDSPVYYIQTNDFYKHLENNFNLLDRMDTSDLPPDHPCYIAKRKEIPCLFSDETNGLVMTHFCTLRAKSYAYRINGKENIRAKGIRGHVVKNHMNFKDHYRCLFGDVTLDTKTENVLIHSFKHQLKTIKSSKVTLIVSMIRGLYLRIKYIPWLMDTTPLRKPIH